MKTENCCSLQAGKGLALKSSWEKRNMSPIRRESRDSDPKRKRSKFYREPSPKRSRRDGKTEAERVVSKKDVDARDGTDTEKKPRQSLRDAAPLEPDAHGSRKENEKKQSGHHETTKQAPHLSELPRSRSDHQHDDRLSDGRGDRRAFSERGSWRSSGDQSKRRAGDDEKSWHRKDRFHESDDTQGTLSRKRPAFSEKKEPEESEDNTDRTEEAKDVNLNIRRQIERNWRSNMHSERHERPAMGRNKAWNRDDERNAGNKHSYRAERDNRFSNNERSGFHGSRTRGEKKWDHDLFEEANKSPARASEEEQIAKVEALLAS